MQNKTHITLKNGKTILRVIHRDPWGRTYVRYNGRTIGVQFICGRYYQVYD